MIRAAIDLGGERTIVTLDVETKEKAIEKIWELYGISIYIYEIYDEDEWERAKE